MRGLGFLLACLFLSATAPASEPPAPKEVAAEIDRLLNERYTAAGATPAPLCSDEDFLRRVAFDLAGRPPKPGGVVKFAVSQRPDKRAFAIDAYLDGDAWAANWASYWREVIFSRATNERAAQGSNAFESWLAARLADGAGWDDITTDLLTATGDVRENGATGLIFAHDGNAEELAGEVSRIFLGIQIQCANCHDHPYDSWKRDDFHTLAAFFPRVRVRPQPMSVPPTATVVSFDLGQAIGTGMVRNNPELIFNRLDQNGDGKIVKDEVGENEFGRNFDRLERIGDTNKDGAISLEEFKAMPAPMNENRRTEWYKPDLSNPSTPGEVIRPRFFLDGVGAQLGTNDLQRRRLLAIAITDPGNVWFARATVNRVWYELVGSGFYSPVDDIGPEREAVAPEVLAVLSEGFTASGYDLKWLLATIANTQAYQRAAEEAQTVSTGADAPFLAATPRRMRADHVYAAIVQAVGEPTPPRGPFFNRGVQGGGGYADRSPRRQIVQLFGFDPSTPHDDVAGDVPQSLFLMNSPLLQGRLRADGDGPLGKIVDESETDKEIIERLYLLTVSRRPTSSEIAFCTQHIENASDRFDAYEDLAWAIMNSAEFVTRR